MENYEIKDLLESIEAKQNSLDETMDSILYKLNLIEWEKTYDDIKKSHDDLREKYQKIDEQLQDNIKRVNFMLLEMKGVISIVRPNLRFWANDKIFETENFTQKNPEM